MNKFFTSSTFTDFKGIEHTVTVCITDTGYDLEDEYIYGYNLGWSCRHANDTHNPELAKQIAFNRAVGSKNKVPEVLIDAEPSGLFRAKFNELAPTIALAYITYLIDNPSIMIKGYKHSKKKFLENVRQK